ncbi:TetR/AcrR family transcriptional regulator [Streptomyces sp. NPDC005356]|uniref:TetR/AcrR family transcriptional regulator n=1 Tax=unclassified Streptomyces TaxID=2593676 RepID=UPI0033AE9003
MSAEREDALLDAALEVLRSVGYDKLTVASVCERAGASTKTAYRRWANKDALLVAALQRAVGRKVERVPSHDRETNLRDSLVAVLGAQTRSPDRASANLVIGLLVASRVDGALGAIAREVIRQGETSYLHDVLQVAVQRGEAHADVDAEFVADMARSFFLHEILVRDEPPSDERILAFVDRVLLPLCTGAPGT